MLYFDNQCGNNDTLNAITCLINSFTQYLLNVPPTQLILTVLCQALMEIEFTQHDVYNIFASLDASKAAGINGI